MQARYVILQVLLEVDGLVRVTEVTASDGQPDLLLQLDRQKIHTSGKAAIADFLQKLQVWGVVLTYLYYTHTIFEGFADFLGDRKF